MKIEDTKEEEPQRNFTIDQLNDFNGTNDNKGNTKPIYIALNSIVFDVSNANAFFGPGGDGEQFAGTECGIELSKHLTKEINLTPSEMLKRLVEKYTDCYPILGKLIVNLPSKDRIITMEELTNSDVPDGYAASPIYILVKNNIYDVSFGGVAMYDTNGPYSKFAGRDVTRALAKMSFEDIGNGDMSGLSEKQVKTLDDWCFTFEHKKKYPIVGKLA